MSKRFLPFATVSLMVATVLLISMAVPATAQQVTFKPKDDVGVNGGYPDSNQGGTDYTMYVGWGGDEYKIERAFMKFDLSSVPDYALGSMDNAILRATSKYGPSKGSPAFEPENVWVDAKPVDYDGWDESTLTWNIMDNTMTLGSKLDSTFWQSNEYVGQNQEYSWDVTSFVETSISGDNVATLTLMSENREEEKGTYAAGWWYTKDADNELRQPRLVLNGLTIPYRTPDVTPGFNYKDAIPGGTENIPVTVKNKGDNLDNIIINASDDAGWNPSISDNKVELAGDASTVVDLTVTIPDGAAYTVTDNVEITSHSGNKPSYSTSENVEVYTSTWLQPPDDDRHLIENQDKADSGDSIYWLYAGANAYDESDNTYYNDERIYLKFDLEKRNLPSNQSMENVFLYLYAYDVPENEAGNMVGIYKCDNDDWSEDSISTGGWPGPTNCPSENQLDVENINQENAYYKWDVTSWIENQRSVDNIVSFCLKAENEDPAPGENFSYGFASKGANSARPYDYSIANEPHLAFGVRPTAYVTENERGGPGDTVTVDVVVNNRGALTDNYSVTIENTSEDWAVSPSSISLSDIAPGENRVVPVTVTIPPSANWGDNQELKVTVDSQTNPDYQYTTTEFGAFVGTESSVDLIAGWNMVSFPVVNETTTKGSLFEGTPLLPTDVTMMTVKEGNIVMVSKPDQIQDNLGYYMKSPDPVTLTSVGLLKLGENVHLNAGWNMVSFPVVNETTTKGSLFEGTPLLPTDVTMMTVKEGNIDMVSKPDQIQDNLGYYMKSPDPVTLSCP